jgi:hypothetical protein
MAEVAVPEVGSVLVSSWGYDQTNVDFYQVVRVSAASVWVVPMSQKVVEANSYMSEYVVPNEPVFERVWRDSDSGVKEVIEVKPEMCRWNKYGYAKVGYNQAASVWDGKPKYQSHYA